MAGGQWYPVPDQAQQTRTYVFLSQAGSEPRIVLGHRRVGDSRNAATEKARGAGADTSRPRAERVSAADGRGLELSSRSGRQARRRRGRREMRGRIIGAVPIGQRPPEAEGRLVPGHHEGDLIMGSRTSNSAVGTIVERMTGYLTLLHLPGGHGAAAVADAVIDRMTALPAWFTRTLTWDRGKELARRQHITGTAGIQVYFADPHAPWQRGSNENINGLLREYLPKGTDLSVHTAADLAAVADELNDRPRKRLGYHTPREMLASLLLQDLHRVATTP